jgi:hypothetical protein
MGTQKHAFACESKLRVAAMGLQGSLGDAQVSPKGQRTLYEALQGLDAHKSEAAPGDGVHMVPL